MTRTKTTKLIAILMAVFMAFAFMSFSMTYVYAEDGTPGTSETGSEDTEQKEEAKSDEKTDEKSDEKTDEKSDEPTTTKTGPIPDIDIPNYTYGAPDINVIIDFGDETPVMSYDTIDGDLLTEIANNIKVYSKKVDDNTYENEVKFTLLPKFNNIHFINNKLTFTIPLSKATGFSPNTDYYLFLGKRLNQIQGGIGVDTYSKFSTKTFTTTRTTTRTTFRTVTTRATTVRARSANTDDPSHLPVWIGLVAASALMLGAVYFVKEND